MKFPAPNEVAWNFGVLPAVEDVGYDSTIILWNDDYIGAISPQGDALNPLRWCDSSGYPQWGATPPTGYWCWLVKGVASRPALVKTWAEFANEPYEAPRGRRAPPAQDDS